MTEFNGATVQDPNRSVAAARAALHSDRGPVSPSPALYLLIFGAWLIALAVFHPRLQGLLYGRDFIPWLALSFFVVFTELAWLYGMYNLGVIVFARWYAWRKPKPAFQQVGSPRSVTAFPAVAVLYTTCNDFVEASARSCVDLDYPDHRVYLLDDSNQDAYREQVDRFARRFPDRVTVIRRPNRKGFKAGNLNHALSNHVTEPLFVLADADEILPTNFLKALVPKILRAPRCGFIQAAHRANPATKSALGRSMGVGIDIHWKWYQPLRNRYGFVMLLGHGALLRTKCWEEVGGFPELVSEDLAYALALREHGYHGMYDEDVVCLEDFPESVRAFRVRHVKWTRGTSEFLESRLWSILRSSRLTLPEKFDILFPTLNLPLSLAYFAFMIDAGLLLPLFLGETRPLTLMVAGAEMSIPLITVPPEFATIFTPGFFFITVLTIVAPVLCFILELYRQPLRLFRFLAQSTLLYASLSPLSAISVLSYAVTGEARFLVTGDRQDASRSTGGSLREGVSRLLGTSHPDLWSVRLFEYACGIGFLIASIISFQVSFLGLSVGFLLLPMLHGREWNHGWARRLGWIPFVMIFIGICLGGFSILGLQTVLFGFGFHF